MEKITVTKKAGEIREAAYLLMQMWEGVRSDIKLNGTDMYNLIALRRTITQQADTVTEAIRTVAQNAGATDDGNGALKIPDNKIEEVNVVLQEIADGEVEISYTPITVRPTDNLPIDLMDVLFDFIKIAEE